MSDPIGKLAEEIAIAQASGEGPPGITNAAESEWIQRRALEWEARLRSALPSLSQVLGELAVAREALESTRRVLNERDRLDRELDDEVDEKEHWLSRVNKLADAIGVEEEWDTENDRSEIALERISELREERDRLAGELAESHGREVELQDAAVDAIQLIGGFRDPDDPEWSEWDEETYQKLLAAQSPDSGWLAQELAELREALAYYADPAPEGEYKVIDAEDGVTICDFADFSSRARKTLARLDALRALRAGTETTADQPAKPGEG